MSHRKRELLEDRGLTDAEQNLVRWLLDNADPPIGRCYLGEVRLLRVVSRCDCGCPSSDFVRDRSGGMKILADFEYDHPKGGLIGVYVYAVDGELAGLDLYSIDGFTSPVEIPDPSWLRPLDTTAA